MIFKNYFFIFLSLFPFHIQPIAIPAITEKNTIPKVVNPDISSPPNIDLNPPKSYNIFATTPYKRSEGKTMILNPDCIRYILLTIEPLTLHGNKICIDYSNFNNYCGSYSKEEFFYHLQQCIHFKYLLGKYKVECFFIDDLSPLGHTFLSNIRSENNWNTTKDIAKKVGSFSLDVLKDIASNVVSNLISKNF